VFYTSVASINIPDYFKTCLYHQDPLSGRQRVGRSLRAPWAGVVNRAKVTVGAYMWACELPVVVLA